jgi:hypothetical protein
LTGVDPDKLPECRLDAGTKLYRLHRQATGTPWYFASGGEGRFDPIGVKGVGICYWAENPLGAWVEVFRTKTTLTQAEVDERRLATLTLTDEVTVIDLTRRKGLGAGVTAALTCPQPGHEPVSVSEPIPLSLVEEGERAFGYTVLPRPSTAP